MMQEDACERCGRVVAEAELHPWTERERNRVFSGLDAQAKTEPGARPVFSYVHTAHAYRVCPRCLAELTAGAPFNAPAQTRSVTMLVAIIALMVGLAVATPFILPSLMSALWRS